MRASGCTRRARRRRRDPRPGGRRTRYVPHPCARAAPCTSTCTTGRYGRAGTVLVGARHLCVCVGDAWPSRGARAAIACRCIVLGGHGGWVGSVQLPRLLCSRARGVGRCRRVCQKGRCGSEVHLRCQGVNLDERGGGLCNTFWRRGLATAWSGSRRRSTRAMCMLSTTPLRTPTYPPRRTPTPSSNPSLPSIDPQSAPSPTSAPPPPLSSARTLPATSLPPLPRILALPPPSPPSLSPSLSPRLPSYRTHSCAKP